MDTPDSLSVVRAKKARQLRFGVFTIGFLVVITTTILAAVYSNHIGPPVCESLLVFKNSIRLSKCTIHDLREFHDARPTRNGIALNYPSWEKLLKFVCSKPKNGSSVFLEEGVRATISNNHLDVRRYAGAHPTIVGIHLLDWKPLQKFC